MDFSKLLDAEYLAATFGVIGVGLAVFAESGLLIGLFLPGDSLLFTAGILAAAGKMNIVALTAVAFVAAVAGDQVGYVFGNRAGAALYRRPDSRFFKKEHLEKAHDFYRRRGPSTIVLARFIPFVRTFAPIVAGAAKMRYATFVKFNIVGACLWAIGVTLAGFGLGNVIPDIDRYLLPIIGVIVLASITPMLREALKHRKTRRAARAVAAGGSAAEGFTGDAAAPSGETASSSDPTEQS